MEIKQQYLTAFLSLAAILLIYTGSYFKWRHDHLFVGFDGSRNLSLNEDVTFARGKWVRKLYAPLLQLDEAIFGVRLYLVRDI